MQLVQEQIDGAQWLATAPHRSLMLADNMGLGKSAQFVRACEMLNAKRITVIAPAFLRENVAREYALWSLWGYKCAVIETAKDEIPRDGVVIVSYSLVADESNGVAQRLMKRGCDILICDEAHALKTRDSERTKATLRAKGIGSTAARMWWITGTPAPNDLSELYSFARYSGAWGRSMKQFEDEFCILKVSAYGRKVVGSKREDELKKLLAPYFLRRKVVSGLVDPIIDEHELRVDAADAYEKLEPEKRRVLEAQLAEGRFNFPEVGPVATARRFTGLAKAEACAEHAIAELENGQDKIVLFYQHSECIDLAAEKLRAYNPRILDGRRSQKIRQASVDAFQNDKTTRVVICQNQAAREGLTLTASNRMLICEADWTPEYNNQIIGRIQRRGQKRRCHISFLSVAGRIDAQITATLARKSLHLQKML